MFTSCPQEVQWGVPQVVLFGNSLEGEWSSLRMVLYGLALLRYMLPWGLFLEVCVYPSCPRVAPCDQYGAMMDSIACLHYKMHYDFHLVHCLSWALDSGGSQQPYHGQPLGEVHVTRNWVNLSSYRHMSAPGKGCNPPVLLSRDDSFH